MNTESGISAPECPAESELSAWFDGEAENPAGIRDHVERCSECRKTIEFYASLSQTFNSMSLPAGDLADRIYARCSRKAAPGGSFPYLKVLSWQRPYMKVAAVLMVATVAAFSVRFMGNSVPTANTSDGGQSDGGSQQVADSTGAETAGGVAETGVGRNTQNESPTPMRFVTLVSGEARDARAGNTMTLANLTPAVLPQSVRHVWVVDDLEAARKIFLETIPRDSVQLCEKSSAKSLCFRVVLTDSQVQQLVDKLGDTGWALVSPSLPQPGEVDRLRTVDKEVMYIAEVVAK